MQGSIVKFDKEKHYYGFIRESSTGKDYIFWGGELGAGFPTTSVGDTFTFTATTDDYNRRVATNLSKVA